MRLRAAIWDEREYKKRLIRDFRVIDKKVKEAAYHVSYSNAMFFGSVLLKRIF